ncbi:MAG: cardiolipin synthase [Desulfovibrionaceae bacterium]|nr:cardiolipin synthase [Desulfovibrionaceae bacterium]
MSTSQFLITLLLIIDLFCVIAVIFFERKSPTATVAWLLVLILLPVGGVVAYVAFGSGFPARRKKRYLLKKANDSLYDDKLTKYLMVSQSDYTTNARPFIKVVDYLRGEAQSLYTDQNAVEIFTSGQSKFDRLLDDISRAQDHIHLFYYIFKNDELGREIVAALAEKARQGIRVRVMYDGLGSIMGFSRLFVPLIRAGGQVRAFDRLLFNLSPYIRINYRNHRKIAVIDGKIGYVGGMNVGNEYLGKNSRYSPWRDTHLRITGPAVWFLQERFWMDWLHDNQADPEPQNLEHYFPEPLPGGNVGIQIVSGGPDKFETMPIKSGFLQVIYDAEESLLIQSPYFIPDDAFVDALRISARAGLDVRVMLPRKTDNVLVQQVNMAYAETVLRYGVRVFLYNGFLHAKTVTCDRELVSIGTTNMDIRSFSLNFEINAFIYNKEIALAHHAIFEQDMKNCIELNQNWLDGRNRLERGMCRVARLFAPLM